MSKLLKGSIFMVLLIVIGVVAIFTSIYTVDQTEYAVIETFGKPSEDIINPGLGFKLPFGIQKIRKLPKETFSMTFGYNESNGEVIVNETESKMVTGDENIILADLEIQWRVVDPFKFLYKNENPTLVLYNAMSSALRGVIGSATVDDALTDGRTEIINEVRVILTDIVDEYDLGVSIVNVNLQDVDLPTAAVDNAFKKVTSAREERITKINDANRYKNEKINTAEGQKEALISKAEAVKVSRIEKARGEVAKFNAIYSEYVKNKNVTEKRLIMEALEEILPNAKVYIMDENSTVKYLPIDALKGGGK